MLVMDYSNFGCDNRHEYLEYLAEKYELPLYIVIFVARVLGSEEEFDGLLTELQTIHDTGGSKIVTVDGNTKITATIGKKEYQ